MAAKATHHPCPCIVFTRLACRNRRRRLGRSLRTWGGCLIWIKAPEPAPEPKGVR